MLSRHTCLMRTPNITSIRPGDSWLAAPWETPDLRAGKLSWIVTVGWVAMGAAVLAAKITRRQEARDTQGAAMPTPPGKRATKRRSRRVTRAWGSRGRCGGSRSVMRGRLASGKASDDAGATGRPPLRD